MATLSKVTCVTVIEYDQTNFDESVTEELNKPEWENANANITFLFDGECHIAHIIFN